MTDDRNDTDGQSPPPLVPPPARLNDLPYQEQGGDGPTRPDADAPVFLEPDADTTDADARDLGRDESATAASASAVSADETGQVRSTGEEQSASRPNEAESGSSSLEGVAATSDSERSDPEQAASDIENASRPTDPAYEERPLDEPGSAQEPVASVDGRERTTDFPTAEPPAAAVPVAAPAADPYSSASYAPTAAYAPAPAQREFVEPPVEPKKKGNRGVGALIAFLSVIIFAVVYALIAAAIIALQRPQDLGDIFVAFVQNPVFYIPTIIFVVAFIIVALLANRASWWAYVLGSLLVGALVYFGTIGTALVVANIYTLSPSEAQAIVFRSAIDPFVITSALVAREVSLWTGAAISARGRRVKAKNAAAREEYDRAAAEHRAEFERPYPLA